MLIKGAKHWKAKKSRLFCNFFLTNYSPNLHEICTMFYWHKSEMWKPFNEFLDPSALPSIMDSQSEKQWIRHHAGDFLSKNKTHCQSFFFTLYLHGIFGDKNWTRFKNQGVQRVLTNAVCENSFSVIENRVLRFSFIYKIEIENIFTWILKKF